MYQGLTEILKGEGDVNGKKIVLPSTFIGGPQAISVVPGCDGLGKAFWQTITLYYNYSKPKVARNSRHTEERLNSIGPSLFGFMRLPKQGLPHAHIIMILAESSIPKTVRDIDALVCAEIPNQEQENDLFSIVIKTMLTAPWQEGSHCWTNCGCKWGYPKPYAAETSISNDAYPVYRCRQGSSLISGSHVYTNQDVIPYNKYLSLRYQCHVNVEIPYVIKVLKYLYKYICKGEDKSAFNLEVDDEMTSVVNGRYIGPSEATWKLFQFHISGREPAIQRLLLHLEDKQLVYFQDAAGAIEQIVTGSAKKTTLT
ncbi:hypothetical protein O181_079223 [Austropuccinia psidii MF-1]|uniref:Helitron helicase-like domain-containing protein n=1 Tax=Austropuccinia psidii MF-1 TaxID=1389203 RepID=A0A9Q3FGA4_9BASI|nr:hypothetical protein [Austropuccinia psidii MF-1]